MSDEEGRFFRLHIINTTLLLAASIEARQFDITGSYLAEDFTFEGLGLLQSGRQTYLNLLEALTVALPDWKLNLQNIVAIEGGAEATINITGTHTGTFGFTDMPLLKPTQKKITTGEKTIRFFIEGGLVARAKIESQSGLVALFKQMGLQVH